MKDKLNIYIFISVLIVLFSLVVFAPRDDAHTRELENREPNPIPLPNTVNIFGGDFSREFEGYVSDKVGFRSYLISVSNTLKGWEGITLPDEAEIVIPITQETTRPAQKPAADTPSPTPVPTITPAQNSSTENAGVTTPPTTLDPSATENAPEPSTTPEQTPEASPDTSPDADPAPIQAGPILKFKDKLVELYGFNKPNVQLYIDVINSYRSELNYKNVRVFSALIPTQIEFIDEKYKSASDSQRKSMDFIKERLSPGIHFVDAYDILKEHSGEYLYFRTDHHWTALGAYYGYAAFAREAGFEPLSLDDYEEYKIEGFLGYLYNYAPSDSLKDNPDYIAYYLPKEPVETSQKLVYTPTPDKPTYNIFMGGDKDYLSITTSVNNGKTVIIVKDSYANAFIPWLAPHYENIIVIDPRHYKDSLLQEISEYDDVDLVFFDYIFASGMRDFVLDIEKIK